MCQPDFSVSACPDSSSPTRAPNSHSSMLRSGSRRPIEIETSVGSSIDSRIGSGMERSCRAASLERARVRVSQKIGKTHHPKGRTSVREQIGHVDHLAPRTAAEGRGPPSPAVACARLRRLDGANHRPGYDRWGGTRERRFSGMIGNNYRDVSFFRGPVPASTRAAPRPWSTRHAVEARRGPALRDRPAAQIIRSRPVHGPADQSPIAARFFAIVSYGFRSK